MSKPLGRDEQMYCTAGVLLAQGKMIYCDFSYVAQLPYHPLLYAILFKVLNTTYYLLTGRLVSVACDILIVLCIWSIYRRVFGSYRIWGTLLGLGGAILYVFNPMVDYANGYAWNNDVVTFCVVFSFLLLVSVDFEKTSRYWRIAAIGALLTFASCMRITTALVELLFLVMLLSRPAESIKQRFKTILPFLVAAAVVLIWPVWLIIQSPRAFFINVFRIHILNSQWLQQRGMVFDKSMLTLTYLTLPAYFVLFSIAACLILIILLLSRRLKMHNGRNALLAGLLPLVYFMIALSLPTIWRQYLAWPVPFLIISFAYPLAWLRGFAGKKKSNLYFKIAVGLVVICILVAVTCGPGVLNRIPKLCNPREWVPVELHRISKDIAEKLKTKNSKLILTLAPLLALEGGCDIYPELSAGSFSYRIGDLMTKADRRITHTVGMKTLGELLEKTPPSAVILGVERGKLALLEAPLQAVIMSDWERKTYNNGFVAYFKP